MLSDKYKEVINQIIESTRNKNTCWERSARSDKFIADFGPFSVTIFTKSDNGIEWSDRTNPIAEMRFLDENSDEFEKIVAFDKSSEEYDYLSSVYEVARRSANDIDSKMDALLNFIP